MTSREIIKYVNENQKDIRYVSGFLYNEGYSRKHNYDLLRAYTKKILVSQFHFGPKLAAILTPYVIWDLYKLEYFHNEFYKIMGI